MSIAKYLAGTLLIPSLAFAGPGGHGVGYDRAKVVGVDPVYQSVSYSVPVEQCRLVEIPVEDRSARTSFTGPIVGAIVGGAIGNAVGHNKSNKRVGTVVGAILGGSIGRDVSNRNRRDRYESHGTTYRTEQVCETFHETREELELTGYEVRYRYAGRIHTTHMDRDPGKYVKVRVQVTPV